MPDSILPPLPAPATPTPVDLDSLAARQARNGAQVDEDSLAFRLAKRRMLSRFYGHSWGSLPPRQKDAATGELLPANQSARRNENDLSPIEVWEGFGAGGLANLLSFVAEVTVSAQLNPGDATHESTGEDMTACPPGWSLTPQVDTGTQAPTGYVVASYAAP